VSWGFSIILSALRKKYLLVNQIAVLVVLLMLSGIGFYAIQTMHSSADKMAQGKDVIADILPPPLYLIGARLLSYELLFALQPERQALIDKLRDLKNDYDVRNDYWEKSDLDQALKLVLLGEQRKYGDLFWKELQEVLIPAVISDDLVAARVSEKKLRGLYQLHRKGVDVTVIDGYQYAQDRYDVMSSAAQQGYWLMSVASVFALILIGVFAIPAINRIYRNLQAALDKLQGQYTEIIDSSTIAILSMRLDGTVMSWNPAAEGVFGYTAAEMLGNPVTMLIPADFDEPSPELLAMIRHAERTEAYEAVLQKKSGDLLNVAIALAPILQADGTISGVSAIVRDITERFKLDQMKTEFVSTVSHELRTPLTAIFGSLSLIAGGALGEMPAMAKKMIDVAYRNSHRLIFLINDLLDMEKLAAGKMDFNMQRLRLMPIIEMSIEGNRDCGVARGIKLLLLGAVPDIDVKVDSQRLQQILANLLSNAIKYSPDNGTVEVTSQVQGTMVRVSIRDYGQGIPAEFNKRIFQKFSQADSSDSRQKGGTGLGLAISRELVVRMGGQIGFDSAEGKGACFFFEFPIVDPTNTR
jgi:PAS domain S-box-containing protein